MADDLRVIEGEVISVERKRDNMAEIFMEEELVTFWAPFTMKDKKELDAWFETLPEENIIIRVEVKEREWKGGINLIAKGEWKKIGGEKPTVTQKPSEKPSPKKTNNQGLSDKDFLMAKMSCMRGATEIVAGLAAAKAIKTVEEAKAMIEIIYRSNLELLHDIKFSNLVADMIGGKVVALRERAPDQNDPVEALKKTAIDKAEGLGIKNAEVLLDAFVKEHHAGEKSLDVWNAVINLLAQEPDKIREYIPF